MNRVLYGDAQGNWAELTWPTGLVSPPALAMHQPLVGPAGLIHLGHPCEVVGQICNRHGGNKRPVQQAIAGLLGVTQQSVSRYALGQSLPTADVLPMVVRMWFDPQLVEDVIAGIEEVDGG